MRWTRRDVLKAGGSNAATRFLWPYGLIGCSLARPLPTVLRSETQLPLKYQTELRIPPVLKPTSQTDNIDRYELTAMEAITEIVPERRQRSGDITVISPDQLSKREVDVRRSLR